ELQPTTDYVPEHTFLKTKSFGVRQRADTSLPPSFRIRNPPLKGEHPSMLNRPERPNTNGK
ncbi:4056_t:CDS:1, partial [Dentiscutata erythropus]